MADSGSFTISRNDTGDRFCNYLNIHRHQNQAFQQHQLRRHNHHHQLHEIAVAVVDADNRTDHSDDSNAELSTRSLISASSLSCPSRPPTNITNLDSLLDSVTPIVAAQKSSERSVREVEPHPYYCLGDLWETFREASAYGAGVPLLLFGRHPTTQYYVPFLSGMQLYIDPQTPHINLRFRILHLDSRSCDLSPSSWICVAWYPIYRIPVGPTLKDLDASFLTFHSLSTQPEPEPGEVDPCGSRERVRL